MEQPFYKYDNWRHAMELAKQKEAIRVWYPYNPQHASRIYLFHDKIIEKRMAIEFDSLPSSPNFHIYIYMANEFIHNCLTSVEMFNFIECILRFRRNRLESKFNLLACEWMRIVPATIILNGRWKAIPKRTVSALVVISELRIVILINRANSFVTAINL